MKSSLAVVAIAAFAAYAAYAWYLLPGPVPAGTELLAGGHADHPGDPTALAIGVVQSVDSVARIVTISHGPLYHLTMPPMTMEFQVADSAPLQGIKAGDRVKFHADSIGGALIVMRIEPAR
jgi:Cu(I)/Ag(I) efflux system periplasmic protein CusF